MNDLGPSKDFLEHKNKNLTRKSRWTGIYQNNKFLFERHIR